MYTKHIMGKPGLRPNTHCCSNMTETTWRPQLLRTAHRHPLPSICKPSCYSQRETIHRKRAECGNWVDNSSLITQLKICTQIRASVIPLFQHQELLS